KDTAASRVGTGDRSRTGQAEAEHPVAEDRAANHRASGRRAAIGASNGASGNTGPGPDSRAARAASAPTGSQVAYATAVPAAPRECPASRHILVRAAVRS